MCLIITVISLWSEIVTCTVNVRCHIPSDKTLLRQICPVKTMSWERRGRLADCLVLCYVVCYDNYDHLDHYQGLLLVRVNKMLQVSISRLLCSLDYCWRWLILTPQHWSYYGERAANGPRKWSKFNEWQRSLSWNCKTDVSRCHCVLSLQQSVAQR